MTNNTFDPEAAQAAYEEGYNLYKSGKSEEAIIAFTKAENNSPQGKYPDASFIKGYCLSKLGDYQEAIEAYTKAENDSPQGKYSKASYNKGIVLAKLARHEEAIEAFTKAENDSPERKFPDASYSKGIVLAKLARYEEAIEAYTKAENDSPQGKFPIASFNKGVALNKLEKHEETIEAYTKAENDSPEGKLPDASLNKGAALDKLARYEEAIEAFTKAENDSPQRKFPIASFNKGVALDILARYEEAIEAFTKAENDSPERKFPYASCNKGIALKKLARHEEAIEAFTKAENDSPQGKHPTASYNKGIALGELARYEEAIIAYTKAENDSPQRKFPIASFNKGVALDKLARYEEAIEAFTKAENDSPERKFPNASFNKGNCLSKLGDYQEAIALYEKANRDSSTGCHLGATVELSKYYFKFDIELSEKYAKEALRIHSREILAVRNWTDNYLLPQEKEIYNNRIKYIEYCLANEVVNIEKNNKNFGKQLDDELNNIKDESIIYCNLLLSEKFDFPFSIAEQYRMAYLIHFSHNRPWETFFIIDELMDNMEELNLTSLDYYFYCLSAYLIGEPVDELKWFWNKDLMEQHGSFEPYNCLIQHLKSSYQRKLYKDGYLLQLDINAVILTPSDINKSDYDNDIKSILACITQRKYYEAKLLKNGILKKAADSIESYLQQESDSVVLKSHEYKNLTRALEPLEISHLINCIRAGVKSKDSEKFVIKSLALFHRKSLDEKNENMKKLYATAQIVVITSYVKDLKDLLFYKSWKTTFGKEAFEEAGGISLSELLQSIIEISISVIYNIPFKLITSFAIRKRLKQMKIKADKIVSDLELQMEIYMNNNEMNS